MNSALLSAIFLEQIVKNNWLIGLLPWLHHQKIHFRAVLLLLKLFKKINSFKYT